MSGTQSDSYLGGLFRTKSAANYSRSRKSLKRYHAGIPGFAKPRAKRKPKPAPAPIKRDTVAEHLSNGLEFDQIAERMGITRKAVEHTLRRSARASGSRHDEASAHRRYTARSRGRVRCAAAHDA
jgi:DNA-binding NarL/FixJ family response regulator